jgi:signal recognition particle subunit SEC65
MVVASGACAQVSLSAVQMERARKIARSAVEKPAAKRLRTAAKEKRITAARKELRVVEMGVAPKRMASVACQQKPKKSGVVLRKIQSYKSLIIAVKRWIMKKALTRNYHQMRKSSNTYVRYFKSFCRQVP